ncbi:hypothetical protein RSAG8_00569, partial [Rhizoctonia solani AG-8 WAC10335]
MSEPITWSWLESERARLLDELRKVNEEREKVDLSESALQREVNEFKIKIKSITEGEYGGAKKEVEKIRKELGMAPLPSLQVTLEEKGARGFIPYTSVFGVTDAGSSHAGSILMAPVDDPRARRISPRLPWTRQTRSEFRRSPITAIP